MRSVILDWSRSEYEVSLEEALGLVGKRLAYECDDEICKLAGQEDECLAFHVEGDYEDNTDLEVLVAWKPVEAYLGRQLKTDLYGVSAPVWRAWVHF